MVAVWATCNRWSKEIYGLHINWNCFICTGTSKALAPSTAAANCSWLLGPRSTDSTVAKELRHGLVQRLVVLGIETLAPSSPSLVEDVVVVPELFDDVSGLPGDRRAVSGFLLGGGGGGPRLLVRAGQLLLLLLLLLETSGEIFLVPHVKVDFVLQVRYSQGPLRLERSPHDQFDVAGPVELSHVDGSARDGTLGTWIVAGSAEGARFFWRRRFLLLLLLLAGPRVAQLSDVALAGIVPQQAVSDMGAFLAGDVDLHARVVHQAPHRLAEALVDALPEPRHRGAPLVRGLRDRVRVDGILHHGHHDAGVLDLLHGAHADLGHGGGVEEAGEVEVAHLGPEPVAQHRGLPADQLPVGHDVFGASASAAAAGKRFDVGADARVQRGDAPVLRQRHDGVQVVEDQHRLVEAEARHLAVQREAQRARELGPEPAALAVPRKHHVFEVERRHPAHQLGENRLLLRRRPTRRVEAIQRMCTSRFVDVRWVGLAEQEASQFLVGGHSSGTWNVLGDGGVGMKSGWYSAAEVQILWCKRV
ncbi:hypothetical protein FN846DRAFT_945881 [Sphaerosporella brunnea]|uniref:Uncharacterized protein n=1 Tax=Sphaerosporella brunnea TaxID=1250544 RepID=A0A5J5EYU0_9PEZI|nr:hypothetical protein FN846DRAFT_945852 [Sphaerosporella brunnea]KAA8908242.1 hypothetical protein FN846DRAFT_945881 [Sphaerosporella brunnea]